MQKAQDVAAKRMKETRVKLQQIDVRMKTEAERVIVDHKDAWMEIKKKTFHTYGVTTVLEVNVPTNSSNTQL